MPKIILIFLFSALTILSLFFLRDRFPIYIHTGSESFSDFFYEKNSEENIIVYFWSSRKNSNFFNIGETYIIYNNRWQSEVELFSVTYASMKPDDIKLGFYISDDLLLQAELNHKFRVTRKVGK